MPKSKFFMTSVGGGSSLFRVFVKHPYTSKPVPLFMGAEQAAKEHMHKAVAEEDARYEARLMKDKQEKEEAKAAKKAEKDAEKAKAKEAAAAEKAKAKEEAKAAKAAAKAAAKSAKEA